MTGDEEASEKSENPADCPGQDENTAEEMELIHNYRSLNIEGKRLLFREMTKAAKEEMDDEAYDMYYKALCDLYLTEFKDAKLKQIIKICEILSIDDLKKVYEYAVLLMQVHKNMEK